MPFPPKLQQIPVPLQHQISLPVQTPLRDVDVHIDVLYQTLLAHVVVLGPYEAADEQVHPRAVEIVLEGVHDVDFLQKGKKKRGVWISIHYS